MALLHHTTREVSTLLPQNIPISGANHKPLAFWPGTGSRQSRPGVHQDFLFSTAILALKTADFEQDSCTRCLLRWEPECPLEIGTVEEGGICYTGI